MGWAGLRELTRRRTWRSPFVNITHRSTNGVFEPSWRGGVTGSSLIGLRGRRPTSIPWRVRAGSADKMSHSASFRERLVFAISAGLSPIRTLCPSFRTMVPSVSTTCLRRSRVPMT